MLTAAALAAHAASATTTATDSYHLTSTCPSTTTSSQYDDCASSSVASSEAAARRIGVAYDEATHSGGYAGQLDSVEKWVRAALAVHGKTPADLVLVPTLEPNDRLASEVAETLARWSVEQTTARAAGVMEERAFLLDRPPPQPVVTVGCNWIRRHINAVRRVDARRLPTLPSNWGILLAGRRELTRTANKETSRRRQADGTRYHHKHDVAPTQEQLTTITHTGYVADQRVSADVLEAVEAGMAVAIYLPAGARGSELKNMYLQSLGHEIIQDVNTGVSVACIKLMAFDTKTKSHHLNQFIEHADPWRCGIALLGLALLRRIKLGGAGPPTSMRKDAHSWRLFGSNIGTLDKRIKETFKIAGLRRQKDDPVTYLGRHFGTRLLQHAGGSTEGGVARTGHATKDARHTYTECPFPDLQKLAGRNLVREPGHLYEATVAPATKARDLLYPQYATCKAALAARQVEVDRLGSKADRVRTEEQLNDQERLLRALDMTTLGAVRALVARTRTWKQWKIREHEPTLWETRASNRALDLLFEGNAPAVEAMDALAVVVRRCEDAEIVGRAASPDATAAHPVAEAMERTGRRQMEMMARMLRAVSPEAAAPPPVTTATLATAATAPLPPPALVQPLPGTRVKHKRELQDEVAHFSSWDRVDKMLRYAREELAPREREHGAKWRIVKRADAREDRAKHKQWMQYRRVALAVGARTRAGLAEADALAEVQCLFDAAPSHTQFDKALAADVKDVAHADRLAAAVLGYA